MQTDGADPAIVQRDTAPSPVLEESIVATAKELALTTPAPSDDPYYGLDRLGGPDLRSLQRLTRHGDFRKYVFVLDAGAGLGGPARWLALRFGCRVLGLDVSPARVRLQARLSKRARLGDRVTSVAGSFEAIPVRDGTFTQIWSLESLHHARDRRAAIAELYRVLRPGSPLALQEIVHDEDATPEARGAGYGTRRAYLDTLRAVGFRSLQCDDVTDERRESSPVVLSAQDRLRRRLERLQDRDAAWRETWQAMTSVAATAAAPGHRVVQIFARRPSV